MSSVFTDPITGATSISGSLTVDNINIRGLSLGSVTLSSNAIWLPSTSLQWTPVVAPDLPTFSIPNGGTMTYSRRNGVYRWIGNDVSYNINVAGLLNTQSTVTTGDYTLNVPYPINVAAYGANALIGELWLTTYYQANSNSFKAYARTIASDANNVAIRVLTGTADVTLTTALSNTTMILQGTMTYNTSSFNQVGGVPAAYLPAAFYQNAAGQVLLNSNVVGGVVAPRGQLDIVYNSNLPALVVDQLGTGDALQVKDGGVTALVVSGTGNVGIGTGNPTQKLEVIGNIKMTGYILYNNKYLLGNAIGTGTLSSNPALSGWHLAQLKNIYGLPLSNGFYWIQSPSMPNPLQMYVNFTADGGGYDFYRFTSATSINYVFQNHGARALGLDIFYPRSKAHWAAIYDFVVNVSGSTVTNDINVPGAVYRDTATLPNGTGGISTNYSAYIMRDPRYYAGGAPDWKVPDGGKWFLRDTAYPEPSGDYYLGAFLIANYAGGNLDSNGNISFNDGSAASFTGTTIICSTNVKGSSTVFF